MEENSADEKKKAKEDKDSVDTTGEIITVEDDLEADEKKKRRLLPPRRENSSYTVAEWSAHRRISRAQTYTLWREGRGPKFYTIGTRRYISAESDAAWLRDREAESAA